MVVGSGEQRLSSQQVGQLGERIGAEWIWAQGGKVLYRNFRAPGGGEVDIVARDGDTLAFIEVKTRTRVGPGRPLDAVDREKELLIERGANEWLRLLKTRDIPWRFDVLEVVLEDGRPPAINRVRNAF